MYNQVGSGQADFLDLRAVLGIIRRQIRLILGALTVVVVLAATYLLVATPKFTSTALIALDMNREVMADTSNSLNNASAMSALVEGEVEILRSSDLVLKLILEKQLIRDAEFGVKLGTIDKLKAMFGFEISEVDPASVSVTAVVDAVKDAISVRRKGLTYLIELSFTAEDPVRAADLANSYVDLYIRQQIENKVTATLAARDILQARVSEAEIDLRAAEGAVESFLEEFVSDYVANSARPDLLSLQSELGRLSESVGAFEQQAQLLASIGQNPDAADLQSQLVSDAVRALVQQRQVLISKFENAKQEGISSEALAAELAQLEQRLADVTANELSATRNSISIAQDRREGLRRELQTSVLNSDLPPDSLADLYALQQEGSIAKGQYEELLRRLRQLDTLSTLQISDATLASKALEPTKPSYPNNRLTLALAVVLGGMLGMGGALLNEFFVGGFTSEDQLRDALRAEVVSNVPAIDESNSKVGALSSTIYTQPMSGFSESFRHLKRLLDRRDNDDRSTLNGQVVLFTSAVPAEGKSTSALSYARTLAQGGQRVIIVDFDLRKPSLSGQLGLEGSSNLLNYLSNQATFEELEASVHIEDESGLTCLVGGGRSTIPTDTLIGSKQCQGLIKMLRQHYDVIVLDGAPVLPVVDSLYLAGEADAIAMMVRFAGTNQRDVMRAYDRIAREVRADCRIVPVLSMEKSHRGSYYYRGYYSGYGYTS